MTNIATLGLRIDSSQTVAATRALNDLTAAAKPAATAAASLEKAGASAAKGGQAIAKSGQLARHEMINLSRQIQDVGVSLSSGQSPFMVLAQQGTQIADIFASSKTGSVGGALKQIVSSIGGARLAMLGLAGSVAGVALMANSTMNSAKAFDDLARSVGAARGELRGFQTAASFKGIGNEDFAKAFSKWGDDIYRAKNGMGGLAEIFRANNVQARTFNDFLFGAADLIKNAADDQTRLQLLQQMGLPATMEWVRFLSQGAAGIKQAVKVAGEFNDAAETKLIAKAREFDDAWNKATTNIGNRLKSWSLSVTGFLGDVIGKLQELGNNTYGSGTASAGPRVVIDTSTFNGGKPKPTVDPAVVQKNIALRQQELGLYGQTITALEAMEQVELQVRQARLSNVTVDQKRVEILKQLAVEQTIGVTAIKAGTDAARIDAVTVGMSVEKATAYAAAQNALNEARRAGRELTPENVAQIQREAAALGQAAGNADLLRFSYTSLVQGPMQTFVSALQQGSNAWDAFKKAGQSALNSIASKLADIAAQNLWGSAFGGSGGGGGGGFLSGILGGLFGGGGGSAGPILGGPGGHVPGFASGTNSAPGGLAVVGERGPELMNVPRGAQIFSNDNSRRLLSADGGGSVNAPVTISIDARGADAAGLARVSSQLAQLKAELPHRVVAVVNDAKRKRLINGA